MSINGVGNNNYNYGNYAQNNVNKTQGTNEVENTSMTSDEFLKELKQEFPEMNIYTGNVTDNNRNQFAGGSGIYNVAVSEEYLDEVASDPQKRAEFKQTVKEMKEAVAMGVRDAKGRNRDLFQFGFVIDDKGAMNSWGSTRVLDLAEEDRRQKASKGQSLFSSLNSSREERKIKEQERAEKRLEKRKLERKEQREEDEKRLEERREEKRMEEKRRLESLNNEDIMNSSVNKVVVDTYQKDINFENNLPDFNTEI